MNSYPQLVYISVCGYMEFKYKIMDIISVDSETDVSNSQVQIFGISVMGQGNRKI